MHISRFALNFCMKAATDVATAGSSKQQLCHFLYCHDFPREKPALVLFQELVDLTSGVELIAEARAPLDI